MPKTPSTSVRNPFDKPVWALAIHGGAGAIPKGDPAEAAYRASLDRVLAAGARRLEAGDSALDVVESLVRLLEDDELFNAGKGAVLNEKGEAELDAAIMDGATLRAGAVASVKTVKNPVTLARAVMERSPHVMLVADGAENFASSVGVERVPNAYFVTERRRKQLQQELARRKTSAAPAPGPARSGTVGAVALDRSGHLAAATSTGGMNAKMPGRVGDAPIIGAGTFADETVAISCTGAGEQFMRHHVAGGVALRMEHLQETVDAASSYYVRDVLAPGDGGLIAVDARGNAALPFNSPGMFRGVADSTGRFDVRIWEN
ncbi:MAG: isoaspartyl peptidase/L-asparaginase [Planctomycetes bacterium]|nr:isoaspartyl peptidase/L-asparaginase [Planctomycetota bacterium]